MHLCVAFPLSAASVMHVNIRLVHNASVCGISFVSRIRDACKQKATLRCGLQLRRSLFVICHILTEDAPNDDATNLAVPQLLIVPTN